MSTTNNFISIVGLDFDIIKENLISFLQDQDEFSEYDFTGSNLSFLLDILAHNTQTLAYYQSMIVNESALESAQIRNNVVSRAKMLGYTPRSTTGSTAIINYTITGDDNSASQITVPKYTKFSSTINSSSYTFNTLESQILQKDSDNKYIANNVSITEGTKLEYRFTVDRSNPDQKFVIPNDKIDTSTLKVTVQNSSSDITKNPYSLATDFITIGSSDKVYWLQESDDFFYELKFGDGTVGQQLKNENIIICELLTVSGKIANRASVFTAAEDILGFSTITTETVSNSSGGTGRETIDSIRFLAPKNYEAQNRAVTVQDYKTILERDYTNISSVKVWGGQDNDPPQYGKIFISIKPVVGNALTTAEKNDVKTNVLNKVKIVAIRPELVDPEFTYIKIDSTVKYNANRTTKTANQLKSLVLAQINEYTDNQLEKFEGDFLFSKFSHKIDSTHDAITNNLTTIKMQKRITPTLNESDTYTLKFYNTIKNPYTGFLGALTSTKFTHKNESGTEYTNCLFEDNGAGTILIKRINPTTGVKTTIESDVGTINYTTGKVVIQSPFKPTSYVGTTLNITVTPNSNDIIPSENQILQIDTANDVTITMEKNT